MKFISTSNAPKAGGHYTQGVVSGNLLFISGQLPITADGEKMADKSIEEQTRLVLENIKGISEAAGSSLDKVVKTTVYISDVKYWPNVNNVYVEFFGAHKPARAIVPVVNLHYGFLIEIDAVVEVN